MAKIYKRDEADRGVKNGHCKYNSHEQQRRFIEKFEEPPLILAIWTVLGFCILVVVGHIRDFLSYYGIDKTKRQKEPFVEGYAPLFTTWESFYTRHVYRRLSDCLNRPIGSCAGAEMEVCERVTFDHGWSHTLTGKKLKVMNFGSYNYLGFAQKEGPCTDDAERSTKKYGCGTCSTQQGLGFLDIHKELDCLLAKFLNVEAALAFPMGFATNSMNLPCIVSKGCLILSDELNHASLILGSRLSGATIQTFKHNDMDDLENKLRKAVVFGQKRIRRAWKKILIVIEGVYSMEGSVAQLPDIIALKKKYKAYLYLDEAHSIGAMGSHGRGIVDYFGVNPRDIDILMGTFTKSFGASGGYIAGTQKLINHLKTSSHCTVYASTMSPCVVQQVLTSMKIIMGLDGTNEGMKRICQLAWNTRYFRRRLYEMGFIVYGNLDSPVVPVLFCMPSSVSEFSRMALKRGLGVVIAGFPATPMTKTRIRFCLSASHTKEMLDKALAVVDDIGSYLRVKCSSLPPPPDCSEQEIKLIELPVYNNKLQ